MQALAMTLVETFRSITALYTMSRAVGGGDTVLTYAELDTLSTRLAQVLARRGIRHEDRVGVYMDPGPESVVAMLGILKAGAAYVPINTALPAAQRDDVLSHCRVKLVLTPRGWCARFSEGRFEILEWHNDLALTANDIGPSGLVTPASAACILYAMGCSGELNGTVMEHKQMVHFATETAPLSISREDKVAYTTSKTPDPLILFDFFYLEVWRALVAGAELVVLPATDLLFARELERVLKGRQIEVLLAPDTVINDILSQDSKAFASLRIVPAAGEVFFSSAYDNLISNGFGGPPFNDYGGIEGATAFATRDIRGRSYKASGIEIGDPPSGLPLYVLGSNLLPVPPGSIGQLYIGGHSVARGYLDRPRLTALCFPPDPFSKDGGRMYATGDLVRDTGQGRMEVIGRIDNQVRIRGRRVDLCQIERAMHRCAELRDAVVVSVGEAESERLVALLVPVVKNISKRGLRKSLREILPNYMVPAEFVVLARIPAEARGGRDPELLMKILRANLRHSPKYIRPRNSIEQYLVSLWEDLLPAEPISVRDDFFCLGGHSLLAAKMYSAVMRDFRLELEFEAVLDNSVLEDLARTVIEAGTGYRSGDSCDERPSLKWCCT